MKNYYQFINEGINDHKDLQKTKIGDSVICTNATDTDKLVYGKTYIIEDIKPGDLHKKESYIKVKNLDKWWLWWRFKIRSLMKDYDVNYYDNLIMQKDINKYNL